MYVNGKSICVETIKEWRKGGQRRMVEGVVNSSPVYLLHCKNFCKYHNIPPPSTTMKRGKNPNYSL
jgi:hypothetical protein